MTWRGEGRPKGSLPNTPWALERLAALLVPHRALVGVSAAQPTPVDWAIGWSDQGNENDCEGHGKEKMVSGTAKAQGFLTARGDVHGVYALRADDYPELPATSPLPDEGAVDATITAGLFRYGMLAAGDGPADVAARLDFRQLERANGYRVTAVAQIATSGVELVGDLITALARGCASFAMQATEDYEALTDGQVWTAPMGRPLGGHCQCVDAWRNGTNGVEFGVEGSWGPVFGRVWIPYARFVAVAQNVTIAAVVPRIAPAGGLS